MFYSQAFLGNVAIILFSITLGLQILLVSINGNLTFLVKFINFSSYHLNGFDCKLESVHNFSNFILRAEDLELLKYSLKHPIHSLQVNKTYFDNVWFYSPRDEQRCERWKTVWWSKDKNLLLGPLVCKVCKLS